MNKAWSKSEIETAWAIGAKAYYDGKKSAPALDKNILAMIAAKNGPIGSSIAILKAWSKGWHAQNLSCILPELN